MLGTYVLMQYFSGDLKANSVVRSPTLRINTLEDLYENRRTHRVISIIHKYQRWARKVHVCYVSKLVSIELVMRKIQQVLYPKDTPVHDELKAIQGPLKEKVEVMLQEGVGLTIHQIYTSKWVEAVFVGKAVLTGERFAARHFISSLCEKTDSSYHIAEESFEKRYFSMVMGELVSVLRRRGVIEATG